MLTTLHIIGVFEFYYAQLAPVIQYRDLRTEVFQSFKEIGNTIVFCLLLEKALVSILRQSHERRFVTRGIYQSTFSPLSLMFNLILD